MSRHRAAIAAAVALAVAVLRAQSQQPAVCDLPLTEQDVREYLSVRGFTILRQRIANCGVTFVTDAVVERRLRESGADDALIGLLGPPPRMPTAGQMWRSPIDRREMAWIPPGTGRIGSPPEEPGRDKNEDLHSIAIEQGFWIDATEVTNQAYRQFVLAVRDWQKGRIDSALHDGKYLNDWTASDFPAGQGDRPVVNVSWHAARAYAAWAGKRLPTEVEWEYAARAGTTTAYWWGSAFARSRADMEGTVQPVGSGQTRNPWGLADVLGNVWEWTSSAYRPYPYVRTDGREDSMTPGPRAVRGGSARNGERFFRAAKRYHLEQTATNDMVGFRCAR